MVKIEKINLNEPAIFEAKHCRGEIAGVQPVAHTAEASKSIEFPAECGYYHILVHVRGEAVYMTDGEEYKAHDKLTFVPAYDKELIVEAITDVYIMEFRFDVQSTDADDIAAFGTKFPIYIPYEKSIQYIDPYKSQKTISRMMIPHKMIPRFSMGSVETYGYDLVKPHTHPMLDQFFFSFPGNDMTVIIDGTRNPMKENEILHIPLGSSHGVEVVEGKYLHYMWIDIMPDQAEGLKRLDASHHPTGLNRSFEKER